MKKRKFYLIAFSIMIAALLIVPMATFAQVESGDSIYVGSDEEITDNFFAAGQSVDLNGHFHKDVYVWGNMVTISGIVDGDVIVAGSNVRVTGEIGGTLRAAGSNIEVDAKIGRNATIAGAVVMIKDNTEIAWDLIVAGGMVSINGPVNGKISVAAGNIDINSTVGDSVFAKVDQQGQFILKPNAHVKGSVYYTWDKELIQEEGALVEGSVEREEPGYAVSGKDVKKMFTSAYWGWKLFSFAALLLIGLIILAIWGKFGEKVAAKSVEKFGKSLGIGFLVFILVPIAFFVLMVTIIGIPLAFVGLLAYGILFYVSKVFASLMVGTMLIKGIGKKKKVDRYLGFLVGLIVLSLIGIIPFIGGLVWFILTVTAFGAFLILAYEGTKSKKTK